MSVKIVGTNVRKVYREVCGECCSMLEYEQEDIQTRLGCPRLCSAVVYVTCPGCGHEVQHDSSSSPQITLSPR